MVYYGGYGHFDIEYMSVEDRNYFYNKLVKTKNKENESKKGHVG